MFMLNYVYIAVAVAFLGLLGVVKYQSSQIGTLENQISALEAQQAVWTAKNKELADRILDQNTRLKEGEEKYIKVQSELDVAKGTNKLLSKDYIDLRNKWKNQPLPKNCPDSMTELKIRSSEIAKKWNTK